MHLLSASLCAICSCVIRIRCLSMRVHSETVIRLRVLKSIRLSALSIPSWIFVGLLPSADCVVWSLTKNLTLKIPFAAVFRSLASVGNAAIAVSSIKNVAFKALLDIDRQRRFFRTSSVLLKKCEYFSKLWKIIHCIAKCFVQKVENLRLGAFCLTKRGENDIINCI